MSEDSGITTVSYDPPKLTVGLLGVEVPPEWDVAKAFSPAGAAFMSALRLDEIERRILAIEAHIKPKP